MFVPPSFRNLLTLSSNVHSPRLVSRIGKQENNGEHHREKASNYPTISTGLSAGTRKNCTLTNPILSCTSIDPSPASTSPSTPSASTCPLGYPFLTLTTYAATSSSAATQGEFIQFLLPHEVHPSLAEDHGRRGKQKSLLSRAKVLSAVSYG